MTGPMIASVRLDLTPLTLDDAEALFAYRSLPEVYRYQTWAPATVDDARTFIRDLEQVAFDTPGTWFQLGVREREAGRLIGDVGVHFLADGEVEIGVTLDPAFQGRGLGTEAVEVLLDHLFRVLGKHRVTASVDPRNEASIRLLQRIGMRQVAFVPGAFVIRDELVDDVVFAMSDIDREARPPAGPGR